jgi:hypothetical protein
MGILGPSMHTSSFHGQHRHTRGEHLQIIDRKVSTEDQFEREGKGREGRHLSLVLNGLSIEELPARHGHNSDSGASRCQGLGHRHGQLHLSAGGGDDEVRRGAGAVRAQSVGAHGNLRRAKRITVASYACATMEVGQAGTERRTFSTLEPDRAGATCLLRARTEGDLPFSTAHMYEPHTFEIYSDDVSVIVNPIIRCSPRFHQQGGKQAC